MIYLRLWCWGCESVVLNEKSTPVVKCNESQNCLKRVTVRSRKRVHHKPIRKLANQLKGFIELNNKISNEFHIQSHKEERKKEKKREGGRERELDIEWRSEKWKVQSNLLFDDWRDSCLTSTEKNHQSLPIFPEELEEHGSGEESYKLKDRVLFFVWIIRTTFHAVSSFESCSPL